MGHSPVVIGMGYEPVGQVQVGCGHILVVVVGVVVVVVKDLGRH